MTPSYNATGRFWLVLILTICVLCAVGCGGSSADDLDTELEPDVPPTSSDDGVIHIPTVPAPKIRI